MFALTQSAAIAPSRVQVRNPIGPTAMSFNARAP